MSLSSEYIKRLRERLAQHRRGGWYDAQDRLISRGDRVKLVGSRSPSAHATAISKGSFSGTTRVRFDDGNYGEYPNSTIILLPRHEQRKKHRGRG